MISAPHVVIYNKTMVSDLNLESPYDLVKGNKWTLDKMIEMAKAAVNDADNDGKYLPFEDTFGITLSEISKFNSFLISCDQPISKKNAEGRLELALNTEKTPGAAADINKILRITGGCCNGRSCIVTADSDYGNLCAAKLFADFIRKHTENTAALYNRSKNSFGKT